MGNDLKEKTFSMKKMAATIDCPRPECYDNRIMDISLVIAYVYAYELNPAGPRWSRRFVYA